MTSATLDNERPEALWPETKGQAPDGRASEVIRRAGQTDPEIGELWRAVQDQLMEDQRPVAKSLAAKGALREGLDAASAADTLWLLDHPSVYYLAVAANLRKSPSSAFVLWP